MPQVILDRAQIMPLVRQRVPAGVAEHVGMDLAQIGALADAPDHIVDPLAGELAPAFGDEQPGQPGIPYPQVAPNRAAT